MIRYLKRYKLLLFITILFTTISSLSYVFIAILLQQVMDIVDMGDMKVLSEYFYFHYPILHLWEYSCICNPYLAKNLFVKL